MLAFEVSYIFVTFIYGREKAAASAGYRDVTDVGETQRSFPNI